MAVKIKKSSAISSLSITPLIDVVFLLLIFFLVATRFAEEDRELDVQLPVASQSGPLSIQPKEVFINIDKNGNYVVNGKTLNTPEVRDVLERAASDNPLTQSVVIRADKDVALQHALTIINLCHEVNIFNYSIATEGDG